MNCPSRVDETILHPHWNQNPPFLAPDLTTRQDLSGIANSREHKYACQSAESASAVGADALFVQYQDPYEKHGLSAILRCEGLSLRDSQHFLKGQRTSRLKFSISNLEHYFQAKHSALWWMGAGCLLTLINAVQLLTNQGLIPLPSVSNSSTALLKRAEHPGVLKRSTCSADKAGAQGDYDLPLHVGAVFIILFVSGSACAFPLIVLKVPRLRIPSFFLFAARHFGTGVLIATAFVHLLPTAFTMLGDPCLSDFWTTDYPAMPGAIVLAAIFFVTIIEMVFSPVRSCYPSPSEKPQSANATDNDLSLDNATPTATMEAICTPTTQDTEVPMRSLGPLKGRSSSVGRGVARMGETQDIMEVRQTTSRQGPSKDVPKDLGISQETTNNRNSSDFQLTPEQKHKKAVMQCALLELGILFHSVFIGMALSVSIGSDFVVLLIAIVFHQTFEGLALGSRIAEIKWKANAVQPWLMALAYGCTTPIGQALGLILHTLYDPGSEVGLLLVGIMNAISSGLLVFASLVELLSEDFLSDESWRILRGKRRVYACILVFLGAFGMSVIGAWA